MSEVEMTHRIVKALEENRVHALAHPTGRLINVRDPYKLICKNFLKLVSQLKLD